ncbi:MAG: SulP family inorganic anion transporter [Methylophilaceae bacterium]|jgi:SulP family sulfate permease|nr:SulP family inorganic anion transporter [Methylophilaceae bacterium]
MKLKLFDDLKADFTASIVVFFVALPLCLGIALASGAPLFSGVIAGIVGGIIVGVASGSPLGVSGPAAGLAVIVLTAIGTLGSFESILLSIVLAGVFQLLLGFMGAGVIAYFFPSSVIKGMLSGIGLLIILKQIPHALGYDLEFEGNDAFILPDGSNTFTEIISAFDFLTPGAVLISFISLSMLILWERVLSKKHKVFQVIQGPVVVVMFGILMSNLYQNGMFSFVLDSSQMVSLPIANSLADFITFFTFPDYSQITNVEIYKVAFVIAIVASLETLLCVEATDKLDPYRRVTPTNRELKAQGLGNIASGLVGGLPITQVVVRSSANIEFGGKSKLSAIFHGLFLLVSVITIAEYLNMVPLASLATILLIVGYKLVKPALFVEVYKLGWEQFVPFIVTIVAIILLDLLRGITAGLLVGIFFTLYHRYKYSHYVKDIITAEGGREVHHIVLAEQVSFFNKADIIQSLERVPANAKVIIDCMQTKVIEYDIQEAIDNYQLHAQLKSIEVELRYRNDNN